MPYNYPVLKTTITDQMLHGFKKSGGGRKITVKFTYADGGSWINRAEMRIVFQNDKVYFTTVKYAEHWVKDGEFHGHMEKSDFARPIKSQHNFDLLVFGYDYKGEALDEMSLVDLALKMFTNMHLTTCHGQLYVVGI